LELCGSSDHYGCSSTQQLMNSFFSGWLYGRSGPPLEELSTSVHDQETPTLNISPPHSSDEDERHENDEDDTPPAFPALSSAQRISTPTTPIPTTTLPKILTDTELMPPPPLPSLASRSVGVSLSSRPSSSLALPPSTTKAPPKPTKKSRKVALAPGHGALDWANLKESGEDLRVGTPFPHECLLTNTCVGSGYPMLYPTLRAQTPQQAR
jgi:hypothetical protein